MKASPELEVCSRIEPVSTDVAKLLDVAALEAVQVVLDDTLVGAVKSNEGQRIAEIAKAVSAIEPLAAELACAP